SCLSIRHGVYQGPNTTLDEIDKSDGFVCAVERLPVLQRDTAKMRAKSLVILRQQQTEQPVCMRVRRRAARHRFSSPLHLFVERPIYAILHDCDISMELPSASAMS